MNNSTVPAARCVRWLVRATIQCARAGSPGYTRAMALALWRNRETVAANRW